MVLKTSLVACFVVLFKWSKCLTYRPTMDVFRLILQLHVTQRRNNYRMWELGCVYYVPSRSLEWC